MSNRKLTAFERKMITRLREESEKAISEAHKQIRSNIAKREPWTSNYIAIIQAAARAEYAHSLTLRYSLMLRDGVARG